MYGNDYIHQKELPFQKVRDIAVRKKILLNEYVMTANFREIDIKVIDLLEKLRDEILKIINYKQKSRSTYETAYVLSNKEEFTRLTSELLSMINMEKLCLINLEKYEDKTMRVDKKHAKWHKKYIKTLKRDYISIKNMFRDINSIAKDIRFRLISFDRSRLPTHHPYKRNALLWSWYHTIEGYIALLSKIRDTEQAILVLEKAKTISASSQEASRPLNPGHDRISPS
jgi:hypothetical protein